MPTAQQRDEVLKAADELRRAKVAYETALARFDALFDESARGTERKPKRMGKAPDPHSVNQRVLAALTANGGPMKVDAIADEIKTKAPKVRNAIVYHQKKGRVVRVGESLYDLAGRQNGSGATAAEL
jgi:hypothetical protein